jgi:hypothetical protein
MLLRQNKVHRWNANFTSFHGILVGSINFTVARVQLAKTLRFGMCCMEDDQMTHFASLKPHGEKLLMDEDKFQQARALLIPAICLSRPSA